MKLSVIIPVYNEVDTIAEVLRRVQAVPIEKEIIVVDDGSWDGTREWLQHYQAPEARVVFHDRNRGKGAAIRTGLQHVTGDVVLIQDADLELDPAEYPVLLEPIQRGETQVVFGSRFLRRPERVWWATYL
ncbi:MAG: glycosyltransferase family 2 protein, partial [Acidobacteria bacterium]|nr:glycosyltransferase family 2 protein [Acidobacteriota bacterium]MDW7985111.1 glycosyltransferase family 2 protein [Acidobacteriota bacterium]